MSSTEAAGPPAGEAPLAPRLGRFHDEALAPLAAAPAPPFPLAPDARCASYWVARAQPAMRREDFLAPSCLDEGELAAALAAHWQATGQPRLAALAADIAALAVAARARPQADGEVSPLIYTMF